MNAFGQLRVIASAGAVQKIVLFPDTPRTKRRMRRLRAKWGDLIRYKPCIFQTPNCIIMHPSLYEELKRSMNGGDQ